MFINIIKDFFLKRLLAKRISNVKNKSVTNTIKTVGILIDEAHFENIESLTGGLVRNGILPENIKTICYKDKTEKSLVESNMLIFTKKEIDWKGKTETQFVNNFVQEQFDMLISYYETGKSILMLTTNASAANFKVGFDSIDNRLNHLIIGVAAKRDDVFVEELFKYLKILNKI